MAVAHLGPADLLVSQGEQRDHLVVAKIEDVANAAEDVVVGHDGSRGFGASGRHGASLMGPSAADSARVEVAGDVDVERRLLTFANKLTA